MGPVLIVDAMNLFARHYIRNPSMTSNGNPAGGIVGFMGALKFLNNRIQPSKIIIAWEGGGSPRRRAIYTEYKANRKAPKLNRYYEDGEIPDTKENRLEQIRSLVNLLKYVPVCQIYVEDCEADDVIGYLSRNRFKEVKKIIASSDKDFYQLLDESTMMYSWSRKGFINAEDVYKEFNVYAKNYISIRVFEGDPSDNIGGVKGAGFKTIVKRFPFVSEDREITYQDIIDEAKKQTNSKLKVIKNICDNEDLINRNWQLMYLNTNNIAAQQMRKIDAIIDNFNPIRNKIMLLKECNKEGIISVDIHDFFNSFVAVEN